MEVRWFNASITVISGTSAVAVMHLGGGLGTTSLRELAAVGAGCTVYFVVDYVVSAVSVALEERSSLASQLRHNNGLLAGLAFVGIDSLGYLAALVGRALPAWASLLLGVPLATILVASRALSRSDEHQRRLTSLFEASGAIFGAGSADEVLDLVSARAMSVLERKDAAAELAASRPARRRSARCSAAPSPPPGSPASSTASSTASSSRSGWSPRATAPRVPAARWTARRWRPWPASATRPWPGSRWSSSSAGRPAPTG